MDLYQNQGRDIACIFLDLEAKNCLFPGHMGSKTWGLKADGHGVASLLSLKGILSVRIFQHQI